jgi:hypothetical protein
MQTSYKVMKVDGSEEAGAVDWPREPGYAAISKLVNPLLGAELEHVSVLHDGKPSDMFVDGDGQIKGLPRNEAATAIYRAYAMKRDPDRDPEDIPWIAGTAVIFDRRIWY